MYLLKSLPPLQESIMARALSFRSLTFKTSWLPAIRRDASNSVREDGDKFHIFDICVYTYTQSMYTIHTICVHVYTHCPAHCQPYYYYAYYYYAYYYSYYYSYYTLPSSFQARRYICMHTWVCMYVYMHTHIWVHSLPSSSPARRYCLVVVVVKMAIVVVKWRYW